MMNSPSLPTGLFADLPGVSPLGLGTNHWGVHRRADPALQPVFAAALASGINLFDTAEIYGLGGSERTLGQFLGGALTPAGQKPVVTSKYIPLPWRLGRAGLLSALRRSLERLNLSQLDLYLVHMPIPPVQIEPWMNALADARASGLVRAVGVSNFSLEQTRRAHAALAKRGVALACNQVEFSLLKREVEKNGLLALCHELEVTLVAYLPFAAGLLSGKFNPDNPPQGWRRWIISRETLLRSQPVVALMRRIGQAHGEKTPSQVALNWLICKGALPIPGATRVSHIQENAGALGWRLNESEIAELDRSAG